MLVARKTNTEQYLVNDLNSLQDLMALPVL